MWYQYVVNDNYVLKCLGLYNSVFLLSHKNIFCHCLRWLNHSGYYFGNTKHNCFDFFSVTEGTEVIFNLIADYVWGSGDELTGVMSDKVESWD